MVFSSEPGNLTNKNAFKYSGLANPKTIGVVAGPENKGVKIVVQKQANPQKPAKRYGSTVVARAGVRRVAKTVQGLTKANFYRADLQQGACLVNIWDSDWVALLARVSAIVASQKTKTAAAKVKKARGKKALKQ